MNYGYTHARYLEYKKSATEDFSGNRLPMVPNHTLSIDGTYTILQAGWFDKIVVNAGFTGLGRIYWLMTMSFARTSMGRLMQRLVSQKVYSHGIYGVRI